MPSNDPRITRPTHQDRVAYATNIAEMAPWLSSDGAFDRHRALAACRLAKLLAYSIPNLLELPPPFQSRLRVEVVAASSIDADPYIRDSSLVAKLLGYSGTLSFERSDFAHVDDPAPIMLFLLPYLCESHEGFARARQSGSLMIGLASNRLIAGLQSVYLSFLGIGDTFPVDCGLGDAVEYTSNPADTMRYGWVLRPAIRHLNSDALLNVEAHIDEIGESLRSMHPLAGSVVSIGDQTLYVGHDGRSISATSRQLAFVRPVGESLYDVELFPVAASDRPFSASGLVQQGCAVDSLLKDAFRGAYSNGEPRWSDAKVVARSLPAVSMEYAFQSARHFLFNDE